MADTPQNGQMPPLVVQQKNAVCAGMMLDNMGGENSEMSAVAAYFYRSLVLQDTPELAQSFHKISVTEMQHMEAFGKLACLLGADPRLWTQKNRSMTYWSPAYLHYPRQLCTLLETAKQSEKRAIEKYTAQLQQICDPNIIAVLEFIISQELSHIQTLDYLLEKYA